MTLAGSNLFDLSKSGFDHLDSAIGLFAYDSDCYEVFKPILHPAICTIHHVSPRVTHPDSDWSNIDHIGEKNFKRYNLHKYEFYA